MRIFILLAILFFSSCDRFHNNSIRDDMEKSLEIMPAPAGTELVSSRKKVGVCAGGDHCDFFAGQLRRYHGDWEKIRKFYDSIPYNRQLGRPFLFQVDNPNQFPCCFFEYPEDWGIKSIEADSTYLLMYFRNEEANSDSRCHH